MPRTRDTLEVVMSVSAALLVERIRAPELPIQTFYASWNCRQRMRAHRTMKRRCKVHPIWSRIARMLWKRTHQNEIEWKNGNNFSSSVFLFEASQPGELASDVCAPVGQLRKLVHWLFMCTIPLETKSNHWGTSLGKKNQTVKGLIFDRLWSCDAIICEV